MISYYGYTISPNQLETGDGFLICRNVPIARVGEQDYLGDEVGKPGTPTVKVLRPEEEVFSDAAIASFEGKPFTDDHPPVLLDADNAMGYVKGHVQNVRRGSGKWKDYLIADIHVHDAATIQAIRDGKREISCGYRCEFEENDDGTMTQREIRGNHVALVDSGRAGDKAAIMDSINDKADAPPERKRFMSKTNSLLHFFGLAASGRSEEEVRRMADDVAQVFDEDTAPEHEPEGEPIPEEDACKDADTDYQKKLFESIDSFGSKLDKLLELMSPKQEEAPAEAEEEKDPLDEALETIGEEIKGADEAPETADQDPAEEPGTEDETSAEAEEAHVVPAEEMDEKDPSEEEKPAGDCGAMDAQTAKAIISAMRPSIAAIKDPAQRKAVTDALLNVVRRPAPVSDAAKIAEATVKNAASKKSPQTDIEAIQAMYDALNPHLNKNKKGE